MNIPIKAYNVVITVNWHDGIGVKIKKRTGCLQEIVEPKNKTEKSRTTYLIAWNNTELELLQQVT